MKERINEIIHQSLGLGGTPLDIRPENTLVRDMGADSLDIVELSLEFEQEYGIVITDDDWRKWRTVASVHAFIECRTH